MSSADTAYEAGMRKACCGGCCLSIHSSISSESFMYVDVDVNVDVEEGWMTSSTGTVSSDVACDHHSGTGFPEISSKTNGSCLCVSAIRTCSEKGQIPRVNSCMEEGVVAAGAATSSSVATGAGTLVATGAAAASPPCAWLSTAAFEPGWLRLFFFALSLVILEPIRTLFFSIF